ncbi:hypothetical protein MGYG_05258 [Nannizzia gypsea CBS 118893]|uniref:HNH nuclease domain-containing protein n=1 Tax=Arthroderma gypseum (strain ATCC MYA-4604 / CBS 118893) TaxID=535722 RepID=E4UVD0_ARTGP|nr:hypothetical protein MGYG_05258 [Nannizzia gypsea CBS 118893]EFR02257.1 hypothetical protein MGYG_05258 [Nannizzia gypsea CBS 118893]
MDSSTERVARHRKLIKDARKAHQRARQESSEELYDTPQFWRTTQAVLDSEDVVKDLMWQRRSETLPTNDDAFEAAKKEYLRQRAAREERRQSAMRREERYKQREKVLTFPKTNNRATLRAIYVDLFLGIRGKTFRDKQSEFIKSIQAAYGSRKEGKVTTYCNILTGEWHLRKYFIAAHIFPLSFGQQAMDHIFGKDAHGEINTARNGLFLPVEFEEAFDAYQVVIVPHGSPTSQPREWQVILLDHSGLKNVRVSGMTFGELHQKKLIFATDARPRARYLYFHFILAMISHYRSGKSTGVIKDELPDSMIPSLTRAWGSEGSYLADNVIHGFIEKVGHELPAELEENMRRQGFRGSFDSEAEVEEICEAAKGIDLRSDEEDSDSDSDDDDFFIADDREDEEDEEDMDDLDEERREVWV